MNSLNHFHLPDAEDCCQQTGGWTLNKKLIIVCFEFVCYNKSECVPVRINKSVNSVSSCFHTINQFGSIWHSQHPT